MTDMTDVVLEHNPRDIPMVDTHLYQYLEILEPEHGTTFIDILVEYLGTFGFEKGRDHMSSEALETLRHIHSWYWRHRLRRDAS